MSYIGNIPAENYASFLTETFSVSATANYTLSHAVSNENDIRLVINNVIQQPGSGKAYTASGTTLTLTSATSSGDIMYAVYLGRALQTVTPPNASVGTSQLIDGGVTLAKLGADSVNATKIVDGSIENEHLNVLAITGQTALTSVASDDTVLISDTSASGALKKMTRANFVAGIGGGNFIKTAGVDISAGGNVILQNCFSSTYTNYFITFERIKNATDGAQCQFTPINSSGATSAEHGYQGLFMGYSQYSNNWSGSNASTYKINENCGNASGEHVSGFLYAFNPNQASASQFSITWQVQANHNGAGGRIGVAWGGGRTATNVSAYTGFKLDYSAGNINSGRIAVYGIVDPT